MPQPIISIVMANYNYGRFLAAAIESVRAQTFTDWELIIVDDGSTDDSCRIIQSYFADQRIRLHSMSHAGQVTAKNTALAHCSGNFVAFLDADDVWESSKLEKQLQMLAGNPLVGMVYTRRTLIDESGRPLPSRQPLVHRGHALKELFHDNFICYSSVMVRKQVLEHVGWFDLGLNLAIDFDLWLRIAKHYAIDFVDEPLVQYRIGHGNLSRRLGERLKTALWIMRRFLHRFGGAEYVQSQEVRKAFAQTCCSMALTLRPYSTRQSGGWFARALLYRPGHLLAWRGMAGLALSPRLRCWMRRKLTGHDWEEAYRVPENDPNNL